MESREITCTRSDLKRLQSDLARDAILTVVQATALLHGTDAYPQVAGKAISEHGIAAGSLLDGRDDPVMFVPLALVDPGKGESVLRDSGLLITLHEGAIIAWQQFRNKLGLCYSCAATIPYDNVQTADLEGARFKVATIERCWEFVPKNFLDKNKRQKTYRTSIMPYILNSFRLSLEPQRTLDAPEEG